MTTVSTITIYSTTGLGFSDGACAEIRENVAGAGRARGRLVKRFKCWARGEEAQRQIYEKATAWARANGYRRSLDIDPCCSTWLKEIE